MSPASHIRNPKHRETRDLRRGVGLSQECGRGGQDSSPTWKIWSEPWKNRTYRRKWVPSKNFHDRSPRRVGLCEKCVSARKVKDRATRGEAEL